MKKALLIAHSPQDNIVGIDNAANIFKEAPHPKSFISLDGADHLLSKAEDSTYIGRVIANCARRYIDFQDKEKPDTDLQIVANLQGNDKFTTQMKAGKHYLIGDEPESYGGNDFGPTPYDSVSPGRLAGVNNLVDLKKMVSHIKNITGGKPVGIKLAAGHIEEDLAFALKADPDFITFDCRGGATGSSPGFLKDNVGIPPVFVIRRARKYLDKANSKVTLCVTGGFRDSSDIAKALALGADAIALATASLISIGCIQARVCHTGTCPAGITTQSEQLRRLIVHSKAVKGFVNFYTATNNDLKIFARSNGVDDIHSLQVSDLVTDNKTVTEFTDIEHI